MNKLSNTFLSFLLTVLSLLLVSFLSTKSTCASTIGTAIILAGYNISFVISIK